MNWLIFWIVIYLVIIVVLALHHLRTSDLDQYLVNNRNTKTLPLVFTMLATLVGGGTSIGLMALGYESGFAAVGIGIGYVIGFMIMTRFAGKIRNYGADHTIYSFPHFLNHKYTSIEEAGFTRAFSATVSGVNIFIFFFILCAQFVAMAKLLEFSFDINNNTATIISAVIIIVYTAIAGLSGVIITDTIQFIAIVIMIILIFIPGILEDTAWFSRMNELPPDFLTGTHLGYAFLIALFIFLPWSVLVRMDVWQRILAAKDEQVARRVSFWSGMGMLPFYIIFPLVGMSVKLFLDEQLGPDETAGVVYLFIEPHTSEIMLSQFNVGPVLFGFAIVGLISALMSSGDSFLNIISISTVKDFVGWGKKKEDITKEKAHLMIRITTIVFGIIALFVAIVFPNIVDLMVVGISTITIFAPITLFALVSKNAFAYRKVALASILSAFMVNISLFTWGIISPDQFQAKSSFIPAFIVAVLVLIIGVRVTRPVRSPQ
jgi:SSS family solute:Na+ symporter